MVLDLGGSKERSVGRGPMFGMAASEKMGVEELLKKLTRLNEVERDGVFLAKEDQEKLPEVKWMVVAKLLTRKQLSNRCSRR